MQTDSVYSKQIQSSALCPQKQEELTHLMHRILAQMMNGWYNAFNIHAQSLRQKCVCMSAGCQVSRF